MNSAVRSLLKRKDVLERFKELLSKNPEKYVLVTETGEEFVLDSEEELLKLVEERKLKNFYFAHEPPKEIKYFVYC
ncbi:hypothetical protein DRO59_07640 [Candidatus Bathyarchaeota archaeon]|nr:MAG: hypothetical protein DRO59_07640 [Candidatus Bathyarchaeota archaeon]